jgi:hypothetical protein
MIQLLNSMPWPISAAIVVGSYILLSLMILAGLRHLLRDTQTEAFHTAATVGFANLGVLYAVLVAFIFVEVQGRHNQLRALIEEEAATVADLYRDAKAFSSGSLTEDIRTRLVDYVHQVVDVEWPAMREQQTDSYWRGTLPQSHGMQNLWDIFYTINPSNEKEKIWLTASIDNLNELGSVRMNRWLQSQESLNVMMWTLLVSGALLTSLFFAVFSVESFGMHAILNMMLNGIIAFLLFLLYAFDNPFSGGARIEPTSFEVLLPLFKTWT